MPGFQRLAYFLIPAILIGCNTSPPPAVAPPSQERVPDPTPSEKPKFISVPTPVPSGPPGVPTDWPDTVGKSGRYFENFDGTRTSVSDWKDPRLDDSHTQPWLISGNWYLANSYARPVPPPRVSRRLSAPLLEPVATTSERDILAVSGMALEFNDMRPQPALSFRRYAGNAFGTTNGELPNNYTVNLQVTPIESREDFYPPVGDQGTPVYYLDPQHYVELLIKDTKFEVWECNGGEPMKWRGWRMLYEEDASHSAGVPVRLGAEVRSGEGTIRVYQDGEMKREVKSSIVKPYAHYFALRAGSNHVQFDDIRIEGF